MRLDSLCKTLSLPSDKAKSLRYQLLHRSASAIYEAKRYRTDIAVILVHSFGNPKDGFSDFAAFLRALGADEVTPGTLAGAFPCDGVSLYAGWVQDEAPKGATASAYLDDLRNYAFRLSQWCDRVRACCDPPYRGQKSTRAAYKQSKCQKRPDEQPLPQDASATL